MFLKLVPPAVVARITHAGARSGPPARLWARVHARLYRASSGRLGRRWFGAPVVVLETRGRRSGKQRATPLIHARDGAAFVVVAANGGSDRDPAWWSNLRHAGAGTVVASGRRVRVRPRVATGEERERLWRLVAAAYPALDGYTGFTRRTLPVIVLEPDQREQPPVDGVRHAMVQAGDVRLHVAEAGDGPPIVLLHGWPQHWYLWREVIAPLAREHRVICPDLRGFGWSEAPPDGYDKETLARDVLALLDALGLERVRMAGHDWGGWVAYLVCMFAPERVERLMVLNMASPFADVDPRALLTLPRFTYQAVLSVPLVGPRAARELARRPEFVKRLMRPGWSDEEASCFLGQFEEPERAHASAQLYRSFLMRDLPLAQAGRYRRLGLRTPTRVVHGLDDPVVRPVHLGREDRHADDMEIELVPGVGHFIVDEQPELVADRLLAFLGAGAQASASTG